MSVTYICTHLSYQDNFFNFVERHNNCEDKFFSGMVAEFLAKNGYNQPCCIWEEGHSKHLEKIASMYHKIKCWFACNF